MTLHEKIAQARLLAERLDHTLKSGTEMGFDEVDAALDLFPALAEALAIAVSALEHYRDSESCNWDRSTVPPRLVPTLGYGPHRAREALAEIRKTLEVSE